MLYIMFSVSLLTHENPQARAPELETTSNGSYTKEKKVQK